MRASVNESNKEEGIHLNVLLSREQARAWSLVLTARRIPHRVRRGIDGYRIWVPPTHEEIALQELRSYETENRTWSPPGTAVPLRDNSQSTLWALLIVTACLSVPFSADLRERLLDAGTGDSGRILRGAWWLLLTPLTLHADPEHLLGNVALGGFLLVGLCGRLGSGLGWGLTLLSGAMGNLVNSLVHGAGHRFIGASTAVFGSLGIAVGLQLASAGRLSLKSLLVPIGGGLALLGFLGTEGIRTDLGAHLFGFLCGLALGAASGHATKRHGTPGAALDVLLAAGTVLAPITAWMRALQGP